MKNTQKGFVGIGLIIAIVVIAAIAGGATYVVKQKAKTDAGLNAGAGINTVGNQDDQPAEVNFDTSSTVQTETIISSDTGATTEGTLYTDPMNIYSIVLPSGWRVASVVNTRPCPGCGDELVNIVYKENLANISIALQKQNHDSLLDYLIMSPTGLNDYKIANINGYESYLKDGRYGIVGPDNNVLLFNLGLRSEVSKEQYVSAYTKMVNSIKFK